MIAELYMLVVFKTDTHISHIKIFENQEKCEGILSTYQNDAQYEATCVAVRKDVVIEFNEKEQDIRITDH